MIFFDTSAALALADADDDHHHEAVRAMTRLMAEGHALLTHNYILVESTAVLQSRLGMKSALAFLADSRNFTVHWVTPRDHAEAAELLNRRDRRKLSLVDCMSFVVMKKYGATLALAYDSDFQAEGFDTTR